MKDSQGVSFIEVIIASFLASIVGVLLISLLVKNNGIYYQQNSQISQNISLNDVTAEIESDIKTSSNIATAYPISSPTYTTSQTVLILSIPSIDASGNLIAGVFDYEVISSDQTATHILRKQLFPDPSSSRKSLNKVLLTNLSSINFKYLDISGNVVSISQATTVDTTISLSNQAGANIQTNTLYFRSSLRNN